MKKGFIARSTYMDMLNILVVIAGGCITVAGLLALVVCIGALFFETEEVDYED